MDADAAGYRPGSHRSLLVDEVVGVLGSLLMVVSPVFLYHIMWPMSDVPATAAWALAMAFALHRRPCLSGTMVGAALAIRPNLVLLSIGAGLVATARTSITPDEETRLVVRRSALGLFCTRHPSRRGRRRTV